MNALINYKYDKLSTFEDIREYSSRHIIYLNMYKFIIISVYL